MSTDESQPVEPISKTQIKAPSSNLPPASHHFKLPPTSKSADRRRSQRAKYRRRVTTLAKTIERCLKLPETEPETIDDLFNDFHQAFKALEAADDLQSADETDDSDAHDDYVEQFYLIKNLVVKFLKRSQCETARISSQAQSGRDQNMPEVTRGGGHMGYLERGSQQNNLTRFPTLNLNKFSGQYSEWPAWRDAFTSIIHNSNSLSDIEKLHYLVSSLSGEASRLVSTLSLTSDNYLVAWDKLNNRYDQPQLIIGNLVEKFINLSSVKHDSSGLRSLTDNCDCIVRALDKLGPSARTRDPWLLHILKGKLDDETKGKLAEYLASNSEATFAMVLSFLEMRSFSLELGQGKPTRPLNLVSKSSSVKHCQSFASTSDNHCVMCSKSHFLNQCREFQRLGVGERRKFASNNMLCFNCLKRGHSFVDCSSKYTCQKCKAKHNSLLHEDYVRQDAKAPMLEQTHANFGTCGGSKRGILATVVLNAVNDVGIAISVRALIDPGAESSFVTCSLARKLQLRSKPVNVTVSGMADATSGKSKSLVSLRLTSTRDSSSTLEIDALTLPRIASNVPSSDIPFDTFDEIRSKSLADPYFYKSAPVDILIGSSYFYDIIQPSSIIKMKNNCRLMNTIFGWVIGGGIMKSSPNYRCHTVMVQDSGDVDRALTRFWELEQIPEESTPCAEEKLCEEHFQLTHRRTPEGRFMVSLPFRQKRPDLGNSSRGAFRAFQALLRRLSRDEVLQQRYSEFMNSYISLGHIELLSQNATRTDHLAYYMPHHAVTNGAKKLRVVFNGSFKSNNGRSLNDELMPGRVLLNDLRSVLLYFRIHRYVFSTDVEMMFRQILIHDEDTNFLRLFWTWEERIATFQMRTLPFGLDCSPYLAERCLLELAKSEESNFPEAAAIIRYRRCMDDIYAGADTVFELLNIRDQLVEILGRGKFPLRKWVSNHLDFLQGLPSDHLIDKTEKIFSDEFHTKSLGLFWTPSGDFFSFRLELCNEAVLTRRGLLSDCAKIFDPFGWIAPVTVLAKSHFQELWKLKLDWDDDLPPDVARDWLKLRTSLAALQEVRVPRWLNAGTSTIVHAFCDASKRAYGTVIYTVSDTGETRLLLSRTKLAPIHTLSIPRLELCAAVLLSETVNFIIDNKIINPSKIQCWSDSQVVLAWIKKHPRELKTFVSNRVAKIQSMLPESTWNYVRSEDNPADICSRGLYPRDLLSNNLWWSGPCWISRPSTSSFIDEPEYTDNLPELKAEKIRAPISTVSSFNLSERFSNLNRLLRVTAYCLMFRRVYRNENREFLTAEFLDICLIRLIKIERTQHFSDTLSQLRTKGNLKRSNKLIALNPFIDNESLLRVGGRLANSDLSFDRKHPIILPHCQLSVLLIRREHRDLNHAGCQSVTASLRCRFWIVSSRNLIRRVLHQCLSCFKAKPATYSQLMGALPNFRLSECRPFTTTGIDYAGPFFLRPNNKRGNTTFKAYVALFICMSVKAVHLEVVSDLSTSVCLAAINRFISRRGRPADFITDNGTNFVGAHNYLDSAGRLFFSTEFNNELGKHLALKRINWRFIPARAPEFGGLWESAVKSCKRSLMKCSGNARSSSEEFLTLLTQVEASLTSRPLVYTPEGVDDLDVITPGHFLVGGHLKGVQELCIEHRNLSLDQRWVFVQRIFRHYWQRWSDEYLSSSQVRGRNRVRTSAPGIGSVGLLKDENVFPLQWRLCRIIAVHPGKDGLVRVIDVKTQFGQYRRPINKFCPLPFVCASGTGQDVRASQRI